MSRKRLAIIAVVVLACLVNYGAYRFGRFSYRDDLETLLKQGNQVILGQGRMKVESFYKIEAEIPGADAVCDYCHGARGW